MCKDRSKNFILFSILSILLICNVSRCHAESTHDHDHDHDHDHNHDEDHKHENQPQLFVVDSELRRGFEPIYAIVNSFIDSMDPELPRDLFNMSEKDIQLKEFVQRIKNRYVPLKWDFGAKESLDVYPELSVYVISLAAFIVLVPIIGLFYCLYKCCIRGLCCKKDFYPYDNKSDKSKRIIYSFISFLILVLLLMLIVILFATNNYAIKSYERSAPIVEKHTNSIRNFFEGDLKNLSRNGINVISNLSDTVKTMQSGFKEKLVSDMIRNVTDEIEKIKTDATSELSTAFTTLNELKEKPSFKKYQELVKKLAEEEPTLENVDAINFDDFTNFNTKPIDEAFVKFTTSVESMQESVSEKFDTINEGVTNEIERTLEQARNNSVQIGLLSDYGLDLFNNLTITFNNYYGYADYTNYVYYGMIGCSILILFIFIIYSFGVLGMCCHRPRPEYRKSCHRGVASRFLMCGVIMFFLFSSILMIICASFFLTGILTRQMVCSPLIKLDDHKVFKVARNIKEVNAAIRDLNFRTLINECRTAKTFIQSNEISKLLSQQGSVLTEFMDTFNATATATQFYSQFTAAIEELDGNEFANLNVPNLTMLMNENYKPLGEDKIKLIKEKISTADSQLLQLRQLISEKKDDEKIKALESQIKMLPDFEKDFKNFSELADKLFEFEANREEKINELIEKHKLLSNKDEYIMELIKGSSDKIVFPAMKHLIEETTSQVVKLFPNCSHLSSLYDDITINVCYEYLDNYNGFWFSLWLSLLIYAILTIFAIKLAALFRKYYPYESDDDYDAEVRARKHRNQKHLSNGHTDVPLNQLNNARRVRPIDAYSDKETTSHLFNETYSPPPSYKAQKL